MRGMRPFQGKGGVGGRWKEKVEVGAAAVAHPGMRNCGWLCYGIALAAFSSHPVRRWCGGIP
jgi:hypothetical protein